LAGCFHLQVPIRTIRLETGYDVDNWLRSCLKMFNQAIYVVGHDFQIPAAFRLPKKELLHIDD